MPTLVFINPMWFGILFAIVGALLIEKLRTSYTAYQEIAIPIIMSAGIALSAIFISLADGFNQEIVGLLFGSISAVNIRFNNDYCHCHHSCSVYYIVL